MLSSRSPTSLPLFVSGLALLACLALTATGIVSSDIFAPHASATLQTQAAILLALSAGLTGLWKCLAGEEKRSGRILIALLFFLALIGAFGAQPILAGLTVVAIGFLTGHAILAVTQSASLPPGSVLTLGLSAVILLLVLISTVHIPMPPVFALIIVASVSAVTLSASLRHRVTDSLRALLPRTTPLEKKNGIAITLLVFLLSLYALYSALPDRAWDPLLMHLLVPTQIAATGRWSFDPVHYAFAYYPMGADYLFSFAYTLGGEMAAKFLNWMILIVITAQTFSIAERLFGREVALRSILLYLTIPLTLLLTASLFVENILALLAISSVQLLLLQDEHETSARLIALPVILGAALAVKLHGLFIAAPVVIIALATQNVRSLTLKQIIVILWIGAVSLALGLLTYLYAWHKTHNPIFPLFNLYFKSPFWPLENFADNRWSGKLTPDILYKMTFKTEDFVEAYDGAGGLGFMVFLVPGLVAALLRPTRQMLMIVIVAAVYTVCAMPQTQYLRYLCPVFPLFVLISAATIDMIGSSKPLREPVRYLALAVAVISIYLLPTGAWFFNESFTSLFNPESRIKLVTQHAPQRLANEVISELKPGARVLYGTDPYGAFLRGTPLYTDWYDTTLNRILTQGEADEATAALDGEKADFVITEPSTTNPLYQKVLAYAERRGEPIGEIGRLTIYKVRPH